MGFFSALNNVVPKESGEKPAGKTPYQANTSKPVPSKKEEADRTSTAYALSNIYDIYQTDPERGKQLAKEFHGFQLDRTAPVYNPFVEPTNPAVAQLQELGFDTSNLDDAWFEKNSWLKQYYVTTDNTTNLSSTMTNKKASKEQRAAYAFNQLDKQREVTSKAQTESAALAEELGYMANDPNHNYSDDYIISHIDWKKYPTLAKMKETAAQGTPLELNAPVEMATDDWMHGVMWAARNGGGTGYSNMNIVRWYQGEGNQWTDDPEISAKLTWKGEDYSPFSVGMTAGEEGRYFGVYSFGEQEIQRLQDGLDPRTGEPLDPNDETAMKMRSNVLAASETTNKAKRELSVFQSELDRKLEGVKDPEQAQKIVEDILDSEVYDKKTKESIKFDTLKKMDASMDGSPDDLLKTTEAIDYRKQDMVDYALQKIQSNAEKLDANQTMEKNGAAPETSQAIETEKADTQKVVEAKDQLEGVATETEQNVFSNTPSSWFDKAKQWAMEQKNDPTGLILKNEPETTSNYVSRLLPVMADLGENKKAKSELDNLDRANREIANKLDAIRDAFTSGAGGFEFMYDLEDGEYIEVGEGSYKPNSRYAQALVDLYNAATGQNVEYGDNEHILEDAKAFYDYIIDYRPTYEEDEEIPFLLPQFSERRTELEAEIERTAYAETVYNLSNITWNVRIAAYEQAGLDSTGLKTAQAVANSMDFFADYEASEWNAYNAYDLMMRSEEGGATFEEVKDAAEQGDAQVQEELENAKFIRDFCEENGIEIPENYKKNLDRHIAKLEREKTDYEYFVIQGNDDFEEMAEKGREIDSHLPKTEQLDTVDQEGFSYGALMTDTEKNTYYYLLAKEGKDAAIRFWAHLNDPEYGVMSARSTEAVEESARQLADSHPVLANALSVLASPVEGLLGLSYMGLYGLTGMELNPKSGLLSVGKFSQTVNEETSKNIQEAIPEGPLRDLAMGAYEIAYNRFRSASNMLLGSPNIGGPLGDILNEIVGALPMAAGAGAMAIADAKEKGADDGTAYLIGGVTIAMESFTEGLTRSNIKSAFSGGGDNAAQFVADKCKEWLTTSGFEEAFGETLTDYVESYVDEHWLGVNSDHQGRLDKYIEENKLDPNNPLDMEKAEDAVRQEEMAGLLHTAIISYLSPGTEVAIASVKEGISDFHNIRVATRNMQKQGMNVSMSDVRKQYNSWKEQAREEQANAPKGSDQQTEEQQTEEQQTADQSGETENQNFTTEDVDAEALFGNQEQTTQETGNSANAAQELSEVDRAFLSDLGSLDAVQNSDSSTQAAAIGAVFGGESDTQSGDMSNAAAANITNVFGSMDVAVQSLKNILTGARLSGIDQIQVKMAIQTAALSSSSEAARIAQSEEFKNASPDQQARMLAETVEADSQNETVATEEEKTIYENRIAEAEKKLIADGMLDGVKKLQEEADKARRTVDMAQQSLEEKQGELQAKTDALLAATNEMNQNPTADNQHMVDRALNEVESASAVEQEYEQHLANVQKASQDAQTHLADGTAAAMKQIRQQAEAIVADQNQQRADREAQIAEQQRIAEEQAAQEQAEEDERTGKTQEDADLAAIDAQIEKLNVKGEKAEKIRQQLRQFYRDLNDGNIDTSRMLTDAESALALGAMSRRLGVMIEVDQKGELAEGQDGKYSNGKILLSNKLTVGQAMVEVAMHEITHSLEGTKSYSKYRSTVLGILYSTPEQLQNAVGERIARYARQGVTLTEGEAEAELVADFAKDTKRFANRDTISRMMDAGLGGKMRNTLHNVNQFLRNMRLTGQEKVNAENLRKAERLYIKAINERRSINTHPSSEQFSVNQFAQAAGLFYNEVNITGKNGEVLAGPGVYNVDPALLNDPNYKGPKPVRIEQITPEMMENTPVGQLTNAAQALGTMDRETVGKVHKMFADLMTLCTNLQDTNIVWEIAGSTLYSEFSAIKSNSDKQYSNTVDFGTICTKTQAVINQLSRDMLRLGRGLTSQEILQVYNDVYNADLKVPCPVCYVFSRWLGVPSLLENIRQYQNRFLGEEGAEVDQKETQRRINEFIEKAQSDYGIDRKSAKGLELYNQNLAKERQNALDRQERIKNGKDGIAELEAKIAKYKDQLAQKPTRRDWQNNLAKAEQKLAEQKEALAQAESDYDNAVVNVYAKAINKKKADIEKSIKDKLVSIEGDDKGKRGVNDDIRDAMKEGKPYDNLLEKRKKLYADIDKLNEQLREVDAYNWVTQSLCYMTQDGDFVIDPEFKRTKNEILLDLNRTGEFAKDTKNWTYRCTRGAGMGKAILPYSGASIGDSVLGEGARAMANPFNDNDGKGAFNALRSAIIKAKRQNLIGGQRFQSTSDFRPEWGLDYIMTFIEQQAIGSNGQLYTKVNEAVPMYASVGIDTNCSIMPYADGYHEPAAGEIENMSEMERKSRVVTFKDADGTEKTVILDFSDVTGMEYGAARIFSKSFDNVQMIMVGINDIHIRACLGSEEIDFVIPWHASGNTKSQLASMMKTVDEKLTNSSDYTKTQTDAIANKEGLKEAHNKLDNGETLTDVEKELIRKEQMRDARIRLLTGGTLTSTDRARIAESEFLTSLYERFEGKTLDGKELPHDSNYWVDVPDYDGNTTSERVKMTSGQAEQIFPYEYWDTSLTKDQADENGWRFVQYCQELGLVPRFSGANQKNEKTGEVTRFGNFSGAVYDEDGNIVEYNKDSMAKGYWKTLIDRKMYDNNGNYRTQKQIDASKVNAGSLMQDEKTGTRIHVGSNIPDQTSGATYRGEEAEAKYKKADEALLERTKAIIAKGDKQSKEYKQAVIDLERMNAYDRAKAEINTQYDLSGEINPDAEMTQGQMLQLLKDAGMDYQDAVARGDMESAQEAMDFYAEQKGYTEKAYHGSDFFGFTEFDMEESQGAIFVTYDKDLARTYSEADDVKPIYESNLDTASDEELIRLFKGANEKAGNTILDVTVNPDTGTFDVTFDDGETESYERSEIVDGLKSFDEDFSASTGDLNSETYVADSLRHGIYGLYARPGNQLVIDGQGKPFGETPVPWSDKGLKTREIAEYAKAQGYDSVRINNIIDRGHHWDRMDLVPRDIGIFFNQEDLKSSDIVTKDNNGNQIPLDQRFTDSPDIRYSIPDDTGNEDLTEGEMLQLLQDAGVATNRNGNVPGSPTTLPGTPGSEGGSAQRQFGSKTAQESDALHQGVKDYLYTHSDYTPDSNQAQIDRATDWVRSKANDSDPDGYRTALEEVLDPSFDYRSADGQARMLTVMSMAALKARDGDQSAMADELRLADAYNQQGTDLGRQLQARKIFRLMTPLGRRTTLQQEVARINQEYKNNGKDTQVELSEWVLKAAEEAQTEEDFEKVRKAAEKELAEQMPANWKEKLQTWRMLSMLANPRTHIRNILGNAIFMPTVGLKNAIGTGLENVFVKEGERTKAIRHTDDAKAFAKEDVKRMQDTLTGEAKYSPEGRIQQNKKAFGQGKGILSRTVGKGVQAIADANSWALEKEDWIFLSKHYQNALASYMTANGLTSEQMTGSTLEKARNYAVLEAQKATYRDANVVSTWLNKASRRGGFGGFLVDTVLPFKKTPANILRRGIEYSPVGLLHSLATARKSLDLYESWTANGRKGAMPKGAKSMTEVLDKVSSGLTGTMIAGLGALGYALGAIKLGFGGDDDDELEKERGSQEYSVELFGHSFTIDWAAPVCMPFFTGAALYKEFSEAGNVDDIEDVADVFGKFINSLGSISEPVFNLSMLDGVSSLLKSASSTQKDKIPVWELLQNIGANYVSSLVPSFSGALARTIDTTRRQNYVEPGDPLRIWKQKVEQAENKIPWLSMRNIPYRNVWGEADVSAPGEAFLENFILPGYLNKMNDDKLTQELQRVYDQTGAASVIPKTAGKTVGTKKLTDQEYDRYVVTRGQTAKQLLTDLIGRDEFIALTPTDQSEGNPEAQVNLIGEVWKYANAVARHEIDPSYTMDKWIASAYADGDPVGMIFAREEEKAQKAYGAQMKNDLFTAITGQDAEAIGACLEGMRQAGEDNKSIRTSVMNNFRDQYKEAYRNGDQETMDAIKYGMLYLDLEDQSFTDDDEDPKSVFKKWRDAVDKGE